MFQPTTIALRQNTDWIDSHNQAIFVDFGIIEKEMDFFSNLLDRKKDESGAPATPVRDGHASLPQPSPSPAAQATSSAASTTLGDGDSGAEVSKSDLLRLTQKLQKKLKLWEAKCGGLSDGTLIIRHSRLTDVRTVFNHFI
jgi:hypothetical protein